MPVKASDNQWLLVRDGVQLTNSIEPVIVALDSYFASHKVKAFVTSGLRDPNSQLKVIQTYLKKRNLDKKYPGAMNCKVTDMDASGHYLWQMAWSELLSSGLIINPPLRAICLMDYFRNGKNKKGEWINQTPHSTGKSFDIGGGTDGISGEANVLKIALAEKKIAGLKGLLEEGENNAVHVDCH
jgi:hypothetical protein